MSRAKNPQTARSATANKWRRGKRWLSIAAGALLLVAALGGYRLYKEYLAEQSTELGSVPRIEVADFWPIFSERMTRGYGALESNSLNGQPQLADIYPIYLVDARPASAYDAAHVRGAIPMPETELSARIGSVAGAAPSNVAIVLYCA